MAWDTPYFWRSCSFFIRFTVHRLFRGILAGIGDNINQYWIISAAPEAPDLGNGLFLTSANLGTTVGAAFPGKNLYIKKARYFRYLAFTFLLLCIFLSNLINNYY